MWIITINSLRHDNVLKKSTQLSASVYVKKETWLHHGSVLIVCTTIAGKIIRTVLCCIMCRYCIVTSILVWVVRTGKVQGLLVQIYLLVFFCVFPLGCQQRPVQSFAGKWSAVSSGTSKFYSVTRSSGRSCFVPESFAEIPCVQDRNSWG